MVITRNEWRWPGMALLAGLIWAADGGMAIAQPANGTGFGHRNDKPDGTAAVSVGQKLPQLFDARVGLDWIIARDMDFPVSSSPVSQALKPLPATGDPSAGAAWATLKLPGWGWDKTMVEARLLPFQDSARLGAVASRRMAVGSDVAVTVESGYAVVASYDGQAADSTGPAFESSQRLGVSYTPTDTSVAIVRTYSSVAAQWLRTVLAEQKLFGGPVSLTAAIGETAGGLQTGSIAAAFRRQF